MAPTRTFLLMGSGEFEPWSEEAERNALEGRSGHVAVLPTASSAEGDEVFERWARMGLEHYGSIGLEARLVDVRTRADAERPERAAELAGAAMVFFSGGKPQHLAATIHGTRLWEALALALDDGAVFAGCSAGALIASQRRERRGSMDAKTGWAFGLGLVPHVSFGVHWDKLKVIPGLRTLAMTRIPRRSWFVGLDERTAILGDGASWRVFGEGGAMVRRAGSTAVFRAGDVFETPG
ncbi:MAG: Type 1 glutamine amidotransferase-like domain-containing protein [Actinobacteria bacterium]|nr:Type 1 glutamine amidotransferase-like domain-containing protein [Actinomycetota bacterium]